CARCAEYCTGSGCYVTRFDVW
nr:immunoglobulin heavy chain junction region [Macaca mulatta]